MTCTSLPVTSCQHCRPSGVKVALFSANQAESASVLPAVDLDTLKDFFPQTRCYPARFLRSAEPRVRESLSASTTERVKKGKEKEATHSDTHTPHTLQAPLSLRGFLHLCTAGPGSCRLTDRKAGNQMLTGERPSATSGLVEPLGPQLEESPVTDTSQSLSKHTHRQQTLAG